jgi:hypothetical protein
MRCNYHSILRLNLPLSNSSYTANSVFHCISLPFLKALNKMLLHSDKAQKSSESKIKLELI